MPSLVSNSVRKSVKVIARIKRTFEDMEKAFVISATSALSKANDEFLRRARQIVERGDLNQVSSLTLDLKEYQNILFSLMVESRRAGRATGITEGLELKQFYERKQRNKVMLDQSRDIQNIVDDLANQVTYALNPENKQIAMSFSVVPYDALKFYGDYSLHLKGVAEQELLNKAKQKVYSGIQNGLSVQNIMGSLESVFPSFHAGRLQNIARTETSKALNQGRIESFESPALKGFITAVEFSAILDSRVTDICEERDGLILAIDDPRLKANTPPLHYQCRSILVPVDKYSMVEEGLDGKVGKGWDNIQEPMEGFGGVGNKKGISSAIGKYIKDDISNWKEYRESDSSMEKAVKNKENAKLLCNKINENILKDYKHRDFRGYVYPENDDVFYYYLKDIDINCPAFYKDGKIYIKPDLQKILHKMNIEDLHIIAHENFHFIGSHVLKGWNGNKATKIFFEEGLTDLLARKFSFSNFLDLEKILEENEEEIIKLNKIVSAENIYDDYCFHMLSQLISHQGQKNNYKINSSDIYKELKQIRTIDVFTEKELEEPEYNTKLSQARKKKFAWQDNFSFTSFTVNQEKFNEVLNNLKKCGILEVEIETYLENNKVTNENKDNFPNEDDMYNFIERGVIRWFLKQ